MKRGKVTATTKADLQITGQQDLIILVSEAPNGILIGKIGVGRNLEVAIGNRDKVSIGKPSSSPPDRIFELIPHQRETDLGRSGRTC